MDHELIIGKYTLESLTNGMYTSPLDMYREYIQNAVDSFDEAITQGIELPEKLSIDIQIDSAKKRMSKLYNELVRQQREAQIQDSELGDIPVMMTVPELGKLLRISRNKAYEYVRSGAVPSIKVGKQIRIYRGDVLPLRRLRNSFEDR